MLSCNCTVFCPCVISLGQHDPTEGYCQTWAGIRIDEGRLDAVDLSGLKVALVAEVPGPLTRGNWTAGLFVDDKASIYAVKALTRIFTGRAGGSTGLLKILVSQFLGVRTAPISYRVEGDTRIFNVENVIDGAITPVRGKDPSKPVVVHNSGYWIAPDVTVSKAERSRMRAFGRNWNFAGRSAEICAIDWGNGQAG
ncbi:MAG: DUF1326 domain-containing protein [Proteobacteria bacterium]|nr:DUF1326 domain-containing protein [Pseudomonadota bacterium]